MQIYVSRQGTPVVDVALGENAPGIALTTTTRMLWLSAGKPVTAAAAMTFIEQGRFQLETPVTELLPEFTGPGTEQVTVWNLLTHTAGLKPIVTGYPELSWEEIIARICAAGLKRDQSPGSEVGYDPGRTWFLLAEILQRCAGQPITDILQARILQPVGMRHSSLSTTPEEYEADPNQIGITYTSRSGGLKPTRGHTPAVLGVPSPGASLRGPISDLGRFYEMLLRQGVGPDGTPVLQPETVRQMTSRQREGKFDVSFQHTVDFGLGLIINSNRYGAETVPYGFGLHAGESAFGHGGSQSSVGFADPEHQLVVAAVANGMPGDELHNRRFRHLCTALYEDLGLA